MPAIQKNKLMRNVSEFDENAFAGHTTNSCSTKTLVRPAVARTALGTIGGASNIPADKAVDAEKAKPVFQLECEDLHEIDADFRYSAEHAAPYAEKIMQHLRSQESLFMTPEDLLQRQRDVSSRMRSILVDWLVEVHDRFRMSQQTLFLAVNYMDRYLAMTTVPRKRLQLLGSTCLFIAAKFEEVFAPEVADIEYVTDCACSREEILAMEADVLNGLDFELCVPTPLQFLERNLLAESGDGQAKVSNMARFFLELTLLEESFNKFKPSQLAASALFLANRACNITPAWNDRLTKLSSYRDSSELRKPARAMCERVNSMADSKFQAVRIKYSKPRHGGVSSEVVPGPVPTASSAGRSK